MGFRIKRLWCEFWLSYFLDKLLRLPELPSFLLKTKSNHSAHSATTGVQHLTELAGGGGRLKGLHNARYTGSWAQEMEAGVYERTGVWGPEMVHSRNERHGGEC